MKYLFYLGHPAHFHLFKNLIADLRQDNQVLIVCKTKDLLTELLERSGWEYENILPEGRKDNKLSIAFGLAKRDWRMLRICLRYRPDLMLGTSPEITHVGALLRIPSLVFNEDDVDVVPLFAQMSYPLATAIIAPMSCKLGKWESKGCKYRGYQKLAYLHPKQFSPDIKRVEHLFAGGERYFILRFVKLAAHHDDGISGISNEMAYRLVQLLEPYGKVWITSERPLVPELQPYQIKLDPLDIHHALYFAYMFIGDSQSMTVESAILGTPALRVSDFVGKISVLEELEHTYKLTYGIHPHDEDKLFETVQKLLAFSDLQTEWHRRRERMLLEKTDVTDFFIRIVRDFPKSLSEIQSEPAIIL